MKPTTKAGAPANPLEGIRLNETDDRALQHMREDLLDLFEQKSRLFRNGGVDSDDANMMINAANAFTRIVGEQRKRAVLRAEAATTSGGPK